jgi:hypothetical protein
MRRVRRVVVMAALAALVIGTIPSVAGAARVTRESGDGIGMACLLTSEEQGTLYMEVHVGDVHGAFAGMFWWAPGVEPFEEAPTLLSGENSVTGTPEGSTLDATMSLYTYVVAAPDDPEPNPYGEPAGEAIVSVSLAPDGDPISYTDGSKGINARYRVQVVDQPMIVSGLIELPGITFDDLSGCQAVRQHTDLFQANPATIIERFEGFGMLCEWTDADRHVQVYASTETSGQAYSEIVITDASGSYFGGADASLDTTAFAASWELQPIGSEGEEVPATIEGELAGSATAAATFAATGEGERIVDRIQGEMVMWVYAVYAATGEVTVTTPAGTVTLSMNEACSANTSRVHARYQNGGGGEAPEEG